MLNLMLEFLVNQFIRFKMVVITELEDLSYEAI